jgi:hypothetical protein
VVPSRLTELGRQALVAALTNVATGEPLVRCQLLKRLPADLNRWDSQKDVNEPLF